MLLSLLLTGTSYSQEIDTLFTTPEERAYLDFLREEFLLNSALNNFDIDEVVPAVPVIVETEEDGEPVVTVFSLGGIFKRQDGTRTIWLNDANIDENALPDNMLLVAEGSETLLRIQTDSGLFDLKAGQTLDVINNRVLESWQLTLPEQSEQSDEPAAADDSAILIEEDPEENQVVEIEGDNIATDEVEEVDPLPLSDSAILSLSAEEISSIIESEDPVALAELMQTIQNFEQVQINDSSQ